MEAKTQVLEIMKKVGVPLNAGKIVELTNLDRKVVDKVMAELKFDDLITSPKRCCWQVK
jgi:DNA-binding IscR family transcriptional regulator